MPVIDLSLALLVVVGVFIASAGIAFVSLAPWLPTRRRDLRRGLALAQLATGERFYDLGCGDGRVVVEAAKRGANATGIELSVAMYAVCRVRQLFVNEPRADFRLANLFNTDLSDADVVYVFGTHESIKKRLLPKLQRELKPGARVVSYVFTFDGWEPSAMAMMDPAKDFPIYLYIR